MYSSFFSHSPSIFRLSFFYCYFIIMRSDLTCLKPPLCLQCTNRHIIKANKNIEVAIPISLRCWDCVASFILPCSAKFIRDIDLKCCLIFKVYFLRYSSCTRHLCHTVSQHYKKARSTNFKMRQGK